MKNMLDALVRRQNELKKDDRGFSLIELLVVVLIIGVLAAIAIPVYMNAVNTAEENAVKGAASTAKATFAQYVFEHENGNTAFASVSAAATRAATDTTTDDIEVDVVTHATLPATDASGYDFCAFRKAEPAKGFNSNGAACTGTVG